jgi:hypothetical protein
MDILACDNESNFGSEPRKVLSIAPAGTWVWIVLFMSLTITIFSTLTYPVWMPFPDIVKSQWPRHVVVCVTARSRLWSRIIDLACRTRVSEGDWQKKPRRLPPIRGSARTITPTLFQTLSSNYMKWMCVYQGITVFLVQVQAHGHGYGILPVRWSFSMI